MRPVAVGSSGGRRERAVNGGTVPEKATKRTGPELNARLTKTRLCRFVTSGRTCPFGSSCTYAHSEAELVPSPNLTKTKVCWSNMYGRCTKGSDCPYAHNEEELRRLPRLAVPLKSGAPLPPSSPYVIYYSEDNPSQSRLLQEVDATCVFGSLNEARPEYLSWTSDEYFGGSISAHSSLQRQSSDGGRHCTQSQQTFRKARAPFCMRMRMGCSGYTDCSASFSGAPTSSSWPIASPSCKQTPVTDHSLTQIDLAHHPARTSIEWLLNDCDTDTLSPLTAGVPDSGFPISSASPAEGFSHTPGKPRITGRSPVTSGTTLGPASPAGKDYETDCRQQNPVVHWDGPIPDLRGDWLDRIKLRDCVSIS
ncbi:zinc finger (ccch type) motif-containing protein [Cystoisospora suis]|uniref:Zinc finger (Ccch type) motif-containing protein n=1 Tax=Cystoisospora suis TaxID=483139 RepID=A0A2C6LHQ0_9APIC|nr:zinc finger (ccch type) motif-containing protein [Cystoisospora suis]